MLAAMRGNAALAQLLMERGANLTRTDSQGKTAAAYASEEGYGDLAGLLSRNQK
jgi:ankyrin repeat protein